MTTTGKRIYLRHEVEAGLLVIQRIGGKYTCYIVQHETLMPPEYLADDATLDECREVAADYLAADVCDLN